MGDSNLTISLTADTSDLQAKFATASDAIFRLEQRTLASASALAQMTPEAQKLFAAMDKARPAAADLASKFSVVQEALQANQISAGQASQALDGITARADRVAGAVEHMRLPIGAAGREFKRLFTELSTGEVATLPLTIAKLAQHVLELNPAGIAAAAGVATLAAGMIYLVDQADRAEAQIEGVRNAMNLVGRGASFDANAVKAAAASLHESFNISERDALDVITTFQALPHATDRARSALAELAIGYGLAKSMEPAKAAEELARVAAGGAPAILRFGEAIGMLKAEERAALIAAQDANDVYAAQGVFIAAATRQWGDYAVKRKEGLEAKRKFDELGNIGEGGAGLIPDPEAAVGKPKGGDAPDEGANKLLDTELKFNGALREEKQLQDDIKTITAARDVATGGDRKAELDKEIATAQARLDSLQGKQAPSGPSQLEEFRAELAQRKALEDGSRSEELQSEIAFWEAKKAQATEGDKEILAINTEIAKAQTQLNRQRGQDAIEATRTEISDLEAEGTQSKTELLHIAEQKWAALLAGDKLNAQQRQQVERDHDRVIVQLHATENEEALKKIEAITAATDKGSEQRVAAAQREAAFVAQVWGAGSVRAIQAEERVTQAVKEQVDRRRQEKLKEIADAVSADDRQLQADLAHLQSRQQAGEISIEQRRASEVALTSQVYAEEKKLVDQEIALYAEGTAAWQAAKDREAAIAQKQADEIRKINDRAKLDTIKEWQSAAQPLAQGFAQTFSGMLKGTETFRSGMVKLADSLVTDFVSSSVKVATDWVAKQAAMALASQEGSGQSLAAWVASSLGITAAQGTQEATQATDAAAAAATTAISAKAAGLAQIETAAAVGAANAMAATAAIPYIGPELAPAAGAAIFADISAYAGALAIPSAAGGMILGSDGLILAHAQEMVLPASLSQGLAGLIDNNGVGLAQSLNLPGSNDGNFASSSSSSGGNAATGDTIINVSVNVTQSNASPDTIAKAVATAVRNANPDLRKILNR